MSIPDDIDTSTAARPSRRVDLPLRVRWSGPPRTYDLDERHDLLLVYEQVMTEGTDDDVRTFIEVDAALAL